MAGISTDQCGCCGERIGATQEVTLLAIRIRELEAAIAEYVAAEDAWWAEEAESIDRLVNAKLALRRALKGDDDD